MPVSGEGESDSTERRSARFVGRVQGVGFRYTTRSIAARLPVAGWVRNLPDGSVELVVEGTHSALDELFQRIADELGRYIDHRELTVLPPTGEFSAFEVRF